MFSLPDNVCIFAEKIKNERSNFDCTCIQSVRDDCLMECIAVSDNTYELSLHKEPSGLGFSVHTDPSYSVTRIKRIFPQGPAAHSGGQLQEGDVILQVNGQKVKGLSHEVGLK